ncbi:putative serine/threonine-protein kinase iks1, variant 4 [Entomophthora muscae]|uniref:Serine/threonine-protein kinase iks1, variant 4 n=2 Tax=Entomophthora muscae TaxID=34485 RepID=A0ACC2U2B1_9FUNG|nr:putative serine/threonine-protein kinase iks1, variant 4 [Entomophthora muscae]
MKTEGLESLPSDQDMKSEPNVNQPSSSSELSRHDVTASQEKHPNNHNSNLNQANAKQNSISRNFHSHKKRMIDELDPMNYSDHGSSLDVTKSNQMPLEISPYKSKTIKAFDGVRPSKIPRILDLRSLSYFPPHGDPSFSKSFPQSSLYNQMQYSQSEVAAVTYHNNWKVILRNHGSNQVVLYNQQNHELAITSEKALVKSPGIEFPVTCRLCNQLLPRYTTQAQPKDDMADEIPVNPSTSSSLETLETSRRSRSHDFIPPESDFVDNSYFRCLAISHSRNTGRLLADDTSFPFKAQEGGEPHILNEAAFNQGYYKRFFIEEKKLGRGARGNVFLCQHILDEIHLGKYAVKKVAIGNDHTWLVRMLKEVHMLERLRHANIIDYKHAWLENHQPTVFAPTVPCLFILMECANGGNLEEYVCRRSGKSDNESSADKMSAKQRVKFMRDKRARRLSEAEPKYLSLKEILSLFLDICHGLSHLHRYSIVHRDLKPPNLLLSFKDVNDSDEIPSVLISDFGECEDIGKLSGTAGRTGATGTLEFMAPELLIVDSSGDYIGEHSPKADMWSLGMVLFYLCYSQLPYRQVEDLDLLRDDILAFHGPIKFPDDVMPSPRIPSEFKRLISLLLSPDPQRRPSVDEILANARDVDFRKLVPGHYYPTSLDSLAVLSLRNSHLRPNVPTSGSEATTPTTSQYMDDNTKCNAPLLPPKMVPITEPIPRIVLILTGIKMATLLFPCYPKSAHLMASIPLTALAIWGVQSRNASAQICLLLFHLSLLTFLFFATGSICGA